MIVSGTDTKSTPLTMNTAAAVFTISRKPCSGSNGIRVHDPPECVFTIDRNTHAIAGEAEAWLDLLFNMDRTWLEARRRVAGRRSNSRAPLAIDVMAATPLISATTLAGAIGMSIKNAGMLLERFCAEGVAVEVTHRSARRLFGLSGLAPLRDAVRPPKRPEPGRGRGRPPFLIETPDPESHSAPLPPMTRFERPAIDYSALEAAMAFADQTIRHSRHRLNAFGTGTGHLRADEPSGLAATGLEPGDCDV